MAGGEGAAVVAASRCRREGDSECFQYRHGDCLLRGGRKPTGDGKIRLLIGAARLDDPIKGLPVLVEATKIIADKYPGLAQRMELTTFGGVKDGKSLQGMGIPIAILGW